MDELSQLRDLLDDVPAPDEARKAQARAELLAQAEQARTVRDSRGRPDRVRRPPAGVRPCGGSWLQRHVPRWQSWSP